MEGRGYMILYPFLSHPFDMTVKNEASTPLPHREEQGVGLLIPQDPFMLMSFVNMKLRDEYSSLDELCASLGVERAEIEVKLWGAGFEYSPEANKFW